MIRRRPLCLALLALVAAGASTSPLAAAAPPAMLLPDLRQELPSELALTIVRTKVSERLRLGFRSATDNLGAGPLEIHGHRPNRRQRFMSATQIVHRADGSRIRRHGAGRLRFIRIRDHQHWHLDDFMRYDLRRVGDFKSMRPSQKTGFCLGDRYNLDIFTLMPNEPDHAIFRRECGLHRPHLLNVHEGISVGHADYYAANIEGQYMDITTLPAGDYWLVHRADPQDRLLEIDETNNAASLLLRLYRAPGGAATGLAILRRCPGAVTCGP